MKCLIIKVSAVLLILPTFAFAGWQVAKPEQTVPSEPFFQADYKQTANKKMITESKTATPVVPRQVVNLGKPAEVYAISVSGSLKENIERIMDRYHWKVVWKAPYDYNFDGRVTGTSLPNVMEKLLNPFPLQAVLYMSNRTMAVVPRDA